MVYPEYQLPCFQTVLPTNSLKSFSFNFIDSEKHWNRSSETVQRVLFMNAFSDQVSTVYFMITPLIVHACSIIISVFFLSRGGYTTVTVTTLVLLHCLRIQRVDGDKIM